MATDADIRPITTAEYRRMGETGLLAPDERVELLDGQLIALPPIGPDHNYVTGKLAEAMYAWFLGRVSIGVQNSFELSSISEPQPDLVLLAGPLERYAARLAGPDDVLLAVEVSISTLGFDRGRKLRAYAGARMREYWIVDVRGDRVIRHLVPEGNAYLEIREFGRGESITLAAFPDEPIAVEEILGIER